jgi:hypothetical protein
MELSMFLAKLLGLYMLIIAAELLLRRRELQAAFKDFGSSKGLIVFSGTISLLMGLAITIGHPVYEMTYEGLITFLGYVLILRGVWRITFPTRVQKKCAHCLQKGYWVIFLVLLIVGLYLTNAGFSEMPMQ